MYDDRIYSPPPKLQDWAKANEPAEDLIYKDGYWHQICFARDKIPALFSASFDEYDHLKSLTEVVSWHMSKSVKLPVYRLYLPDGITLTMRYNFYDWKVSVESLNDIDLGDNVDLLLDGRTKTISSVYCEGFPTSCLFEAYGSNKRYFTISVGDDYRLYALMWAMGRKYRMKVPNAD